MKQRKIILEEKESGKSKTILFNLCGHGNFDMKAHDDYFEGKLVRYEFSNKDIAASLAALNTPEIA